MKHTHSIVIGKAIKKLARLRGGGSALPGLVVEKIDKNFLAHAFAQIPQGVILVTGTNGKTTTTKMITELLQENGLRVLTNRSGSNFTRGIIAALLEDMDNQGQLNYDIAVLELDEAHAKHFVAQVKPRIVIVLNIMRDQLDRFGEIDQTATLLQTVVQAATESVILNRDDTRVTNLAKILNKTIAIHYFGAGKKLQKLFVNDDNLHSTDDPIHSSNLPADVELADFKDQTVTYKIGKTTHQTDVQVSGVYNFLNGAAALTVAKLVVPHAHDSQLVSHLSHVRPAFGRGEMLLINGQDCELILVKNPAGFRLALTSFKAENTDIMVAINDNYADGRDMSWLWDVDFSDWQDNGVQMVSGIRAYDMALRLQYDNVVITAVEPNLQKALQTFLAMHPDRPKHIFCTYTAMLSLRRALKKYTHVEQVL